MTRRSVITGLGLSILINLWPAYSSLIVHSSRGDYAHLSVAFLIPFMGFLVLNLFLERRGRGFTSSELLTLCCIGMVAACMQGEWLSGYFLGIVTAPHYFADARNLWADRILLYLPDWTYVSDKAAATGFYESLPGNQRLPWRIWVPLLMIWGSFFMALLLANFCLVVLFRKQWMDHERLTFPIATALLELTGVSGSKGTLSSLVRARLFQMGFFIILAAYVWNVFTWFVIALPPIQLVREIRIPIARDFPPLLFLFQPMTMAFAYFTKSDVLLSIWFFHVLAVLQIGLFRRLGFDIGGADYLTSLDPIVGWQSFGGMIVFVFWGLWAARDHFKLVFQKAFYRTNQPDDSNELMSYRTAVWLLAASGCYLIFFLHQAGMGFGTLLAFWFATLVLYLGLARIIVESGLVFLRGTLTAQAFVWHVLGITGMGPFGATALGLTYTFFCDAKTFGITALAHVPRLSLAMESKKRRALVPVVLLGCLLGAATVIGFTLYEGYHVVGSYNFGVVSFNGSSDSAVGIWRHTSNRIGGNVLGTDWRRIRFLGIGAIFTTLLFYIRHRFPSFPIHPIGFTISSSSPLRSSASSIFMTWLIKTVILKLGGLELYRKIAPFFLGLMAGQLAGLTLGLMVDIIWFPGQGHQLNRW